jgi:hypothetical protein
MKITDFQNPTKVNKLLGQFVVMSSAQAQDPSQTAAAQLLNGIGSTNIINVTLPTTPLPASDIYSSGSAAAMLLSTAIGG